MENQNVPFSSLKYDAWNRLVGAPDDELEYARYEYDGLGQRIVRVDVAADPDVTYDYYYNARWQLLEERAGSSPNPAQQFVWHPYYIDALAVRWYDLDVDGANMAAHYYCQDANFNVTAVTDAGGTVLERYSYTPYGEVTFLEDDFDEAATQVSDIGNTHLYTGRERDTETGLQLNRHRYYAPHLGRWPSGDPIGYTDNFNLYLYVGADPLGLVDASGLYLDIGGYLECIADAFCGPGPGSIFDACGEVCRDPSRVGLCWLCVGADAGWNTLDCFLKNWVSDPPPPVTCNLFWSEQTYAVDFDVGGMSPTCVCHYKCSDGTQTERSQPYTLCYGYAGLNRESTCPKTCNP